MNFNLDNLRIQKSRLYFTNWQNDEVLPIYFDMISMQSKQYKKEYIKQIIEHSEVEDITKDEAVREKIDVNLLASLVVGWHESFGEFSKEAVLAILTDEELPWIYFQAETYAVDRKNFFHKP